MGLLNDSSQKKQLKIMPSVYSVNLVFPGLVLWTKKHKLKTFHHS